MRELTLRENPTFGTLYCVGNIVVFRASHNYGRTAADPSQSGVSVGSNYFAFYLIERYVDPNYRFSGLLSFVR
jgi:hypothetical protein